MKNHNMGRNLTGIITILIYFTTMNQV